MALKHIRNYSTVWAQSLGILDDAKPISFATFKFSHTEPKKKKNSSPHIVHGYLSRNLPCGQERSSLNPDQASGFQHLQ
jgi:hypothetical protein